MTRRSTRRGAGMTRRSTRRGAQRGTGARVQRASQPATQVLEEHTAAEPRPLNRNGGLSYSGYGVDTKSASIVPKTTLSNFAMCLVAYPQITGYEYRISGSLFTGQPQKVSAPRQGPSDAL